MLRQPTEPAIRERPFCCDRPQLTRYGHQAASRLGDGTKSCECPLLADIVGMEIRNDT